MREQTFFTDVLHDGKIQANISFQIKEALKPMEGKRIFLKIGIARKIRSLNQNKYYWAIIVEYCRQGIMEQWGENITKDQAHNLLKQNCNFIKKINEESDGNFKIPIPTHILTTTEFCEYTERCRKFIGEFFGITIPNPDSQEEISY